MRVQRYTNAYGYNFQTIASSDRYRVVRPDGTFRSWIGGGVTQEEQHRSCRRPSSDGGYIGKFRKPTFWSMLATRTTYGGHSYRYANALSQYDREGYGGNASHGLPFPHRFSIVGDKVVVDIDQNLVNQTVVEARKKLSDMTVNVGAALAESKQTLGLIADLVVRLCEAIRHARRRDWVRAGQALGIDGWRNGRPQAEAWLIYQYGFTPLFSDLYNLQERAKNGFRSNDQLFKVSSQAQSGIDIINFISPSTVALRIKAMGWGQGKANQIVRTVYYQKISDASLSRLTTLGVTNPASVAWELTPWSFVIDWLIPISAFLEAVTGPLGMTYVAGFEDRIVHADISWKYTAGLYMISGKPYTATFKQFAFQRIVKTTWGLPVPYWRNPFTTNRLLNAIALANSEKRAHYKFVGGAS